MIFAKFISKNEEKAEYVFTDDFNEGDEVRDTIIRLEAYDADPE